MYAFGPQIVGVIYTLYMVIIHVAAFPVISVWSGLFISQYYSSICLANQYAFLLGPKLLTFKYPFPNFPLSI